MSFERASKGKAMRLEQKRRTLILLFVYMHKGFTFGLQSAAGASTRLTLIKFACGI